MNIPVKEPKAKEVTPIGEAFAVKNDAPEKPAAEGEESAFSVIFNHAIRITNPAIILAAQARMILATADSLPAFMAWGHDVREHLPEILKGDHRREATAATRRWGDSISTIMNLGLPDFPVTAFHRAAMRDMSTLMRHYRP